MAHFYWLTPAGRPSAFRTSEGKAAEHLGLTALIPLPIISNFAREQFTGVQSTEINGDLNA